MKNHDKSGQESQPAQQDSMQLLNTRPWSYKDTEQYAFEIISTHLSCFSPDSHRLQINLFQRKKHFDV